MQIDCRRKDAGNTLLAGIQIDPYQNEIDINWEDGNGNYVMERRSDGTSGVPSTGRWRNRAIETGNRIVFE